MKNFLTLLVFISFSSFGQNKYKLTIRLIDTRSIYLPSFPIPNIELTELKSGQKIKIDYIFSNDTIENFTLQTYLSPGKYLINYENYFSEKLTDTILMFKRKKLLTFEIDKLKRKSTDFFKKINQDTIFVRNEFQACRYSKSYNFTITNNDGKYYFTNYSDRSYFPDTTVDKSPTLNEMAFLFDRPLKKFELNFKQKLMVNRFLNELIEIKDGGTWSSTDMYVFSIGNSWSYKVDKKNYWLGAYILYKQLEISDK